MAAPKKAVGPKSDKLWRNAIMLAVNRAAEGEDGKQLDRLARRLIEKAAEGDVAAMREIGDRLDGKPTQPIAGDPEGAPIETRTKLDVSGLTDAQLKAVAAIKVG